MKKLIIAAVVVMAGVFGIFQANNNNAQMSELQLENLEALADNSEILNICCENAIFNSKWCYVTCVGGLSGHKCSGHCPYPCLTGHLN